MSGGYTKLKDMYSLKKISVLSPQSSALSYKPFAPVATNKKARVFRKPWLFKPKEP
jgi:hypothetical protein